MKNQEKTLVDMLHNIKRGVYTAITLVGLTAFPPYVPAQAGTITETETFNDGSLDKSSIAEHPAKWSVKNQQLEAQDFDETWGDGKKSGSTHDSINDKLYPFTKESSMSLEVTINASAWGSDADRRGIVIAADPIGGTYYAVSINAHPNIAPQIWIEKQSPGLNHTYVTTTTDLLNRGGPNTIKVTYTAAEKYSIFLNGKEFTTIITDPDTGLTADKVDELPLLEGYIGFHLWDSMGANDPAFSSTTSFDDLTVAYNSGSGVGGGGQVVEKGIGARLQTHIPELFLRGDSNMDKNVNITDALYTLSYLFKGARNPEGECYDAMDANDDSRVDISDPIRTLFHLFVGGERYVIPPPNIGGVGMDLTHDALSCNNHF